MSRKQKQAVRLLTLNLCIVSVLIFCYSPGFLALRPTDASVFRAGSSIFLAVFSIALFLYGNLRILSDEPKERISYDGSKADLVKAEAVLKSYAGEKTFGTLAKTALDQAKRLERSVSRAEQIIAERFGTENATSTRYLSVLESASDNLLQSLVQIAVRMQMFDEKEYTRPQHYKEDDIPDSVQEKQIALYQKNMDLIRKAIKANEEVLLKVDELSMELSISQEDTDTGDLLAQIEKLTGEVKYYI